MAEPKKENYSGLVKALQIAAGVFMLCMVVLCLILMKKYEIKVSNIPALAEKIQGGTLTIAIGVILFAVIKSFALVFPPAVLISICAYMMPDFWSALAVNLISVALSFLVPYFLGKFTGAGMVNTLKGRFKAIQKIDEFAGANEIAMTAVIKFAGILPGDVSSLLFGAMNIGFKNYMLGCNLGMLPLCIVYTFFGVTLKNVGQKPWLAAIPVVVIVVFMLIAGVITKFLIKKTKEKNAAVLTQDGTKGE